MSQKDLSPREEEIVSLCVEGLTNEQIAYRLEISIGTVNTYWLRIKLKVGGLGKTDTVVKIIKERAEKALRDANVERKSLADIVAEKEANLLQYRAALALLQLALEQIQSTVWATDPDLAIHIIANGSRPSVHNGVTWDVGTTVYEIFETTDAKHPAIAAHLGAIAGKESELRLDDDFPNMLMRVMPLFDEAEEEVLGCISILNKVPE